jgi:predicted permease
MWRSLPVPEPQQLHFVDWKAHQFPRVLLKGASGSMDEEEGWNVADFFSYSAYAQMRESIAPVASLAAYTYPNQVSVSFAGRPDVAQERAVSGNFFSTLRIQPRLGRALADRDDSYAAPPVAVVSHRFWVRALGSDPSAIGRTLNINSHAYDIVGVLDATFYGLAPGDATDLYTPLHHATFLTTLPGRYRQLEEASFWGTQLLARRWPEHTPTQLLAALEAVFPATWVTRPKDDAAVPRIHLVDGRRGLGALRQQFGGPLLVLGGLVTLLLAIACVNIANLLLARANARRAELAMRVSLGCSRGRLMRQLLTESALLALLGGAASVGIAWFTATVLGKFLATDERTPIAFTLNGRTLAFASIATAVALLFFGLFPAWQAARRTDTSWLRSGAGSTGVLSRGGWAGGRVFVTFQMALSVILVMSAVVFTRNLTGIQSHNLGFDRRNLVLFGLRPGTSGYDKFRLPQFYFNLEQRLQSVPGVASAGLAAVRPMNIGGWWEMVSLAGQTERFQVNVNRITPSYLPLYTQSLVAGRNFTRADLPGAPTRIAIISEDLAKKLGGPAVLGRLLAVTDGPPDQKALEYEIIGIAPVIAATSIKNQPYVLWLPFPGDDNKATVVLRTHEPPQAVLPAIQKAMREIDSNLPMVETITMEEQISKGIQRERMFATLCNGFGILALVLSIVGLYGVVAYGASRRRNEIGVRLALGARPADVVALIVKEGMATAALGIVLGVPLVWLAGKYVQKELTNSRPLDAISLGFVTAIFLIAALAAAGLPALRASALDPAAALRQE